MSAEINPLSPVLTTKADFSDKLSPMIVKELRQGLRTRTFLSLFIGLQIFLSFMILLAASSESYDQAGDTISGIILFLFALAALAFQPMRGVSAIANEIKQDTIDLMVLTKLNAWKIVYGKWLAIVSQTALLFVTVVPYLVMRYFFGGMELVSELMTLLSLFLFSMILTAITVGLSANPMPLIRFLFPVLGIPILLLTMLQMLSFRAMGSSNLFARLFDFSDPEVIWSYLGALGFGFYLAYYFLEMGATSIAPMAENRTTRKRLVGGFVLIATLLIFTLYVDEEAAVVLGTLICLLIGLDVLTERKELASSVTAPFVKRGKLGILAGRFFYPGWPTGLLFFGACVLVILLTLGTTDAAHDKEVLGFCLVTLFSTLLPCVLARFFEGKINKLLSFHIIIWFSSFIIVGLVLTVGAVLSLEGIFYFLIPLPFGGYVMIDKIDKDSITMIYLFLLIVTWLGCLFKALPAFTNYRQLESTARAMQTNDD